MNNQELMHVNPVVSDYLDMIAKIENSYTDDAIDMRQLVCALKLYSADLERRVSIFEHSCDCETRRKIFDMLKDSNQPG